MNNGFNTLKNITSKEIFRLCPEVKANYREVSFLSSGYYVNIVGQCANKDVIKKYLQN